MGNHLSGIVPVQMHPVEYYLSDIIHSELISFDCSLGSTRFFKVARIKLHQIRPQLTDIGSSNYSGLDSPGLGVAKVFVINDLTLPLRAHKEKIDRFKEIIKDNPNSLLFNKSIINDKAAVLLRQYIKYNLYDRLSTRPFLTFFEKNWIAFQLLKCCEWIHTRNICHGDIKLENILITSYLWALLTDFATYKPVYLPEDNPADFSYFFDTSRRRICNVAPERFINENNSQQDSSPSGYLNSPLNKTSGNDSLNPSMDLFSLGCVLAELFTEDSSSGGLFEYGELLAYKRGDRQSKQSIRYYKVIESIPNVQIRKLVLNLTELEPNERKSASYYLQNLTPTLFPSYFNQLFVYIKDIIKLPPDEKVVRLASTLHTIVPCIKQEDSKGFLLLIVLVTSALRSMKHVYAKIVALRLLCDIVNCDVSVLSDYILDRVLPYLLVMLRDSDPRVRAEAIASLQNVLSKVQEVTPGDNNVFPDYILPNLLQIAEDRSVFVRLTLSKNLADLASISLRFLSSSSQDAKHYESELSALHNFFQAMVSSLLTDANNNVKIALLLSDINKLCDFFGSQRTNDVILSHIFTFLNKKEGCELRCAFFDSITSIASYLGPSCLPLIKPFLQQGISDYEEIVIYKALTCLSNLTKRDLWDKTTVFDVLNEAVCLLSHPNVWIRHALVYFIHLLAENLSLAEVCCKIMPVICPYLVKEIYSLGNKELLLETLKPPLPKSIFDKIIHPEKYSMLSSSSLNQLIECLRERKRLRLLRSHGQPLVTCPLLILISKHEENGLTEEEEEKILNLSNIFRKMHKHSKALPSLSNDSQASITYLSRRQRKTHSISLNELLRIKKLSRENYQTSSRTNMNEEWHTMFGSQRDSIDNSQEILDLVSGGGDKWSDLDTIPIAHEAKENTLSDMLSMCPPCVNDLVNLINHKKNYFLYLLSSYPSSDCASRITARIGLTSYKPKGYLLAHLHEHSNVINRIVTIESSSLFVTCSSDSTVKVWEAQKIEDRECMINKSRQTFKLADPTEGFKGIAYCAGSENLICYTSSNSLYILRVDTSSSHVRVEHKESDFCMDAINCSITDITSISPYIFATSTTSSKVRGYDLRQPSNSPPIWTLDVPLDKGLITCIDGNECLLACGTSRGNIINFDLRFTLVTSAVSYSKDRKKSKRIMRILLTSQGLYSAVQGNNEVVLWDCGTTEKLKSFWASSIPALSQETRDPQQRSVMGMVALTGGDNECLVTGGIDRRIRYWDPKSPTNCSMVSDCCKSLPWSLSPTVKSYYSEPTVSYESRLVEGIQVIQEHRIKKDGRGDSPVSPTSPSPSSNSNAVGLLWDQSSVSLAHRTSITDLAWINKMNLLISASSDGCVKVWR